MAKFVRAWEAADIDANGQPAFGAYLRGPSGVRHGIGLFVLTLAGGPISAMTRFENSVLPGFGLPRSLPNREGTADPQRCEDGMRGTAPCGPPGSP